MAKIAEAKLEICLPRTQAFCHFTFLTFQVFFTAATERNTTANKIPLHCCALFIGVLIEESVATVVVHAAFYRTVTERTRAF